MSTANQTPSTPRFAAAYKPFLSRAWAKTASRAGKWLLRASGAKSHPASLQSILHPAARSRWMLPSAQQMTPALIESILRGALTGTSPQREHELYSLMEQTWPRLAKNVQELKNAVIGLEWAIMHPEGIAPNPDTESLIRRARLGMRGDPITGTLGWEAMLRHLLDAWFRGISLAEISWAPSADAITPTAARVIPPYYYGWGNDTLQLYPTGDPANPAPIPRDRVLIATRNASSGHPSGGALLRSLAWWWCAANFSSAWFLNFAQIFGQPFRFATYTTSDAGAAQDLATMLAEMGPCGYGVAPEGTNLQTIETTRGAGDNPQLALLDRADSLCDILILGQTLTTDVGDSGSRALGEVHANVRADIVDSAANWLAEILNEQLLPTLIALNTGTAPDLSALPYWEPSRKQSTDTKLLAETLEILTRAGLPIPKAWAYASLDIPAPQAGEAVLTPPTPDLAPALARMPVEARAYVLAKLRE